MKIFVLIIILTITGVGIYFGCRLLRLQKRNKWLQIDKNELIKKRAEQSDQLRQKGIEIDELKKELDKYSEVEIKVALNTHEKQMILNALDATQYKTKIQAPATKYFIREIYRGLKQKIKESIKEE